MGLYGFTVPSGQVLGMDGEGPGFSSTMPRLPGAGLSLVLLGNVAPGGALFEQLRDDVVELLVSTRS